MFTLCSPFQLAFVSLGTYGEVKVISENMEAVNFKENERLSRLDDGNDLPTDTVFQSNENLKPSVLEYVHKTTLAFLNTTMESLSDNKTLDDAIDSNVSSDAVANQLNVTENSSASSVVIENKNITSYVVPTACVNETAVKLPPVGITNLSEIPAKEIIIVLLMLSLWVYAVHMTRKAYERLLKE